MASSNNQRARKSAAAVNQDASAQQSNYQFPPTDVTPGTFADQYGPDAMSSEGFNPAFFPPHFKPVTNRQSSTEPSNQLMRRSNNQQLTPARNALNGQQQWLSASPANGQNWEELAAEEDLNARAAIAKQEAQAKRKQIPPFVAKLWSFLDEDKNTDLIRWTDNGTAFTVLDEDEFARTLIPELFKHNNYASFVRQLNMYGFHKKVGLNANSMKAAEKKTKDPNVYWHEYFRQGREELLWLIQKPQTKTSSTKRKRGADGRDDSDDDRRASPDRENMVTKLQKSDPDVVAMPKTEVVALRQEVQKLQRQQSVISQMITRLKDQNEQFYRQASEFQSLHDRHENSINAILTFLATFYNRSLEAGVDLSNMFGNQNAPPQHGTVVDVGDTEFPDNTAAQQVQRYRKPQLLLQSSPGHNDAGYSRISTQPPSSRPSASPPAPQRQTRSSTRVEKLPSNDNSPLIKDEVSTPAMDNSDMMSLINAANANTPSSTSPQYDFTSALNHAQNANGQAPLTPQQRDSMLSMIANQQAASGSNPKGANNNALINPTPPPVPDLNQFTRNQEQLEYLTRLQKEQDSKVQDLAGRLQPLSPSGSIPGLDAYGNATPSADFDFDAFLNNPYTSADGDAGIDGTGSNLDFNFDTSADPDELFANIPGDQNGTTSGQINEQRVQSVHSASDANEEDEVR